jgi:hypothetical protein
LKLALLAWLAWSSAVLGIAALTGEILCIDARLPLAAGAGVVLPMGTLDRAATRRADLAETTRAGQLARMIRTQIGIMPVSGRVPD